MPRQQAREPADAADDGAGVFGRHGRRDGGLYRTAGDPATPGQTEQGRRGYRQGRLEGQDQSNGGGAGEAGAAGVPDRGAGTASSPTVGPPPGSGTRRYPGRPGRCSSDTTGAGTPAGTGRGRPDRRRPPRSRRIGTGLPAGAITASRAATGTVESA